MTCGDSWSEESGNRFEIGSISMWVLLTGRETGIVCLHTQLFTISKTFAVQCNR